MSKPNYKYLTMSVATGRLLIYQERKFIVLCFYIYKWTRRIAQQTFVLSLSTLYITKTNILVLWINCAKAKMLKASSRVYIFNYEEDKQKLKHDKRQRDVKWTVFFMFKLTNFVVAFNMTSLCRCITEKIQLDIC